jgi:hypothetical protein
VIVLEAEIAGQVSAIDDAQIREALGACREVGRLRLDLHDVTAGDAELSIWSQGQQRIETGVQQFLRSTVRASAVHHVLSSVRLFDGVVVTKTEGPAFEVPAL